MPSSCIQEVNRLVASSLHYFYAKQCQANIELEKRLHVLQLLCFTVSTALFLLKMSNTGSILELFLKDILSSFVDKQVLPLQIKIWFGYIAVRNFKNKVICSRDYLFGVTCTLKRTKTGLSFLNFAKFY